MIDDAGGGDPVHLAFEATETLSLDERGKERLDDGDVAGGEGEAVDGLRGDDGEELVV